MSETERDYSKERDERALPVVKEIYSQIASYDFNSEDEKKELFEKAGEKLFVDFVAKAIEKDIRVSDLPYTFSLAKRGVSLLKTGATTPNDERDEVVITVALEILQVLSEEEELNLLEEPTKETEEKFVKLFDEKCMPIIGTYGITHREYLQVFAYIDTFIGLLEGRVANAIVNTKNEAEAKLWGVEHLDDVTVKQVHLVLLDKKEETE